MAEITYSRSLAPGYAAEVDIVEETQWYELLAQFEDQNIYQTWSYDEVRGGQRGISHLVLKKHGEVVALGQSRVVKVPLLNAGIAYVRWGPIWQRRDETFDPECFRQAIRALRNEYVVKRGLVLRIYPLLLSDSSPCFLSILADEGFSVLGKERPDRTLLLDLRHSCEELRAGMKSHRRRDLKIAEKNNPEIIEGSDDELFQMFVEAYKEMVSRKKFREPNNIAEFRLIQKRLPERCKMRIILSKTGGVVSSGLVCSAMGNTAVYLFGATSNAGVKNQGEGVLLHWKLIEWLQHNRFETYDLNGIDPVSNLGTYRFKSGLCGDQGRDVFFLGRFQTERPGLSYALLCVGEWFRGQLRRLRQRQRRVEQTPGLQPDRQNS